MVYNKRKHTGNKAGKHYIPHKNKLGFSPLRVLSPSINLHYCCYPLSVSKLVIAEEECSTNIKDVQCYVGQATNIGKNQEQAAYVQEQQQLQSQLNAATQNLSSLDLATKEQATTITKLRNSLQNLKPPYNNKKALQTRLSYLQNQLHVRKQQSVSGYVS